MHIEHPVEKFGSYVVSQGQDACPRPVPAAGPPPDLAVTISHQAGIDVSDIAEKLAGALQRSEFKGDRPWSALNQQLLERALEEQHWPRELAGKIAQDKRFIIDELMDDLCGLCPPSWAFVPQVVETIQHLAAAGHVILVGHGATIVTAKMTNVYHVRLTGSLAKRIEHLQIRRNLTPEAAARAVGREDRGRRRYLKAHFHASLDNELLYDLVINTDRVSNEDAVGLIFEGARRIFNGPQAGAPAPSHQPK